MPSCTKVEVWWIGGVIEPVDGSGSWPACTARVAKPCEGDSVICCSFTVTR